MKSIPDARQENVRQIGRVIYEKLEDEENVEKLDDKWTEVAEKLTEKKEVINTSGDDVDLYTTAIADFIEAALKPKLVARGVFNEVSLTESGYDSIDIPTGNLLGSAQEVNTDGSFTSESTEGFDSTTINTKMVGEYTLIPQQLVEKANVDLLGHRMGQIGFSIARKIDDDIISALNSNASSGDNYVSETSAVTWNDLVNMISTARSHYADPDLILLSNENWKNLMQDSDMKDALAFGTSSGGALAEFQQFGTLKVMVHPEVNADDAYVIDTDRTGYYVDAGDVQTYDGRVAETVQNEVMGVKRYGVGVTLPNAYVRYENTSA